MRKSSRELYAEHCTRKHGEDNWDWTAFEMYKGRFANLCRKGFFESAEKVNNIWLVDELEYFAKADEFSPYIRNKNASAAFVAASIRYKSAPSFSTDTSNDIAKMVGGIVGVGLALVLLLGLLMIPDASSRSSSGVPTSSSIGSTGTLIINGTSYTQKELEEKLRREAEDLFDNCQMYGKSFSDKCP